MCEFIKPKNLRSKKRWACPLSLKLSRCCRWRSKTREPAIQYIKVRDLQAESFASSNQDRVSAFGGS